MTAVAFQSVDIVFGDKPERALSLLDQGATRAQILAKTGLVLGAADASLEVEEGEICVLMGLSGSGKSTLLRAVNRLNEVTRGAVTLADGAGRVDVARCDAATLRRLRTQRIAMVFQQFALLPWRSVRENVGFGLELRGTASAERDAIVDEKLKLVGLDQWADKYAHELSGGMQQRVGLARAFATDADILLMDEPFSALDPLIREHLQEELLALQRRLKKTIIFVSHDLDEALKLGNQIAIMEEGRIVQSGSPETIVLNPINEYVAAFVAHMNPLKVLRGSSVMRPVSPSRDADREVLLDAGDGRRLVLDEAGAPHYIIAADGARRLETAGLAAVSANSSLQDIIALRQETGEPVLLVEAGRVVGICGDTEIYEAILKRAEPEASEARYG